jgi:hypothetical protein
VKRDLGNGYELDDDRSRIDREAVHHYLSEESYWAKGRPLEVVDDLVENAARVVGLYHCGRLRKLGFAEPGPRALERPRNEAESRAH